MEPRKVSGGFIGGAPPVPIPNTEVKPSRADGTARFPCGRVGRCRNIIETPRRPIPGRGALFFGRAPVWFIGRQSLHPFPSRTRKLSPPEPMVLHGFRVGE